MSRRGLFSVLLLAGASAAGPDLDVAFVSRTPRYDRYLVEYDRDADPACPGKPLPLLTAAERRKKRWPARGERVVFTAVVKNPGDAPTGAFEYAWHLDGARVLEGTLPSLAPGQEARASLEWRWDSEEVPHFVRFSVDPHGRIREDIESNNTREEQTNALSFRFHVWQGLYDWFRTDARKVNPEIASFDDWAQEQVAWMNRMFRESTCPGAPQGILERVRLDEIVVVPEDTPDPEPSGTHAPVDLPWDGKRGFRTAEYLPIFRQEPEAIRGHLASCLHELSHQLGLIDLYQINMEEGMNLVRPDLRRPNSRAGGMMTSCGPYYSDHSVLAMNANLHRRRGYYGEYLYDLPRRCGLFVLDAWGRPLAGAKLTVYQDENRQLRGPPVFRLRTDDRGRASLPNRSCGRTTETATGHRLRDNPWGMIDPVGLNALFLVEIRHGERVDTQFVDILPFNVAFWNGASESFTYPLRTTIVPGGPPTEEDLHAIAMAGGGGAAVGGKGVILEYDGDAWRKVPSPARSALRDVALSNALGCAVGDGGALLLRKEGAWREIPLATREDLRACAVGPNGLVLVGGSGGRLWRSGDGGVTWASATPTPHAIVAIAIDLRLGAEGPVPEAPGRGVLVHEGRRAMLTEDGGLTWREIPGDYGGILSGCAMREGEAWLASREGAVFRGPSFEKEIAGWSIGGISVSPEGRVFAVGEAHAYFGMAFPKVLRDGRWIDVPVITHGADGALNDVAAVAGEEAWAVGRKGLILRFGMPP
ncbi:MAG: hypothetical protein L6Q95_07685 [Planctomycetes bacterium]|nr:hypothetical protein [Planctomycetota bacterium]